MAAKSVCRSCLQSLRMRGRAAQFDIRSFSTITVPAGPSTTLIRSHETRHKPTPLPSSPHQRRAATNASNNAPPPPPANDAIDQDDPTAVRVAKAMREQAADFTETYVAMGATQTLFKECARQADYIVPQAFERNAEVPQNEAGEDVGQGTGWWYENLGLTPTFSTWTQVTMLHMYLLTVRLRYFPPSYATIWMQHLTDHFFYEAEHRMTIFHQISSRMIRNRYLKDLYNQWRGITGAYDEGLIRGDAVMAAAVWRNVFQAKDDVDWTKVAIVVGFMRRSLRGLDRADDKRIVGGLIKFGSPMTELGSVEEPSVEMGRPFELDEEQALEKLLQEIKTSSEKR